MKKLFILFWFAAITGNAQRDPRVNISPEPGWIKNYPYAEEAKDTVNSSGGYFNLLSEEQYNAISKESFFHYAQKVVSENGLENVSTISQNFDPAYQKLVFHKIDVIRNGTRINQLKLGEFKVLKREQNLERLVYDGNFTAVFNLDDVQVGDIVDYSFTIRGQNPLYRNKFSRLTYLNYSVPVGLIVRRMLVDADREYQLKKFNNASDPGVSIANGEKTYEWVLKDVPAYLSEESTPNWFDPYDHVQISDFGSWNDLALWASSLFDVNKGSGGLLSKIAGIKKENKEESIRRIIQFVQDEVRYLSFSEGIHGYKPHASEKILIQRFGDCKDKSLLLSTLLTELGVQSEPVLVNTGYGKTLPDYLPAPYLFNHCIVRFTLNDSTYWIDPTISLQRGALKKIYAPHYYQGLVISRNSKSLEVMPRSPGGSIVTREEYFLDKVGGGATLKVETTYTRDEADNTRSSFKSSNPVQVQKQYLNFYATDYPNIKSGEPLKWTDSESDNKIVSTELYEIDSVWQFDSLKSVYSLSMYPRNLATYLAKPTTKIRDTPFALRYPTNIDHQIVVHLPEEWTVEPLKKTIESTGFSYYSDITYQDKTIVLNYSYKAKKPYLERSEVRDYIAKIEEASKDLTFNITKDTTIETNKFNYAFLIVLVVALAGCFVGVKRLNNFDPDPKPSYEKHSTIGGWLILPAIGLSFSPLKMIYDIYQTDYFTYTNWRILADSSFAAYNPTLGIVIVLELVFNTALTVYTVFLVYAFFQRRSNVPILAAVFYITALSFLVLDALAVAYFGIENDESAITTIIRSAIGAAIWVPYFLLSERSKGTFTVRRYNPTDLEQKTSVSTGELTT